MGQFRRQGKGSGRWRDKGSFLDLHHTDRRLQVQEAGEVIGVGGEGNGELPSGDSFDMHAIISLDNHTLFPDELRQELFCLLEIPYVQGKVTQKGVAHTGYGRIIERDFTLVLRFQQIFIGGYFTFLNQLGIISDVGLFAGNQGYSQLILVHEGQFPSAPYLGIFYLGEDEEWLYGSQDTRGFHRGDERRPASSEDIGQEEPGRLLCFHLGQ